MFDFDAAIEQSEKDAKSPLIEAIVLAPSGGGKSYLAGTFDCKTLYLYASGENHGVKAARTEGGANVVPVCVDLNGVDADTAIANLLAVLHDHDRVKRMGFGAVVVDGASELEVLIRNSTAWKKACQTNKGAHNTFAEPTETLNCFRPIITALKDLQRATGVHFYMTCIIDVKDMGPNGEITEASPRLKGFSVAEGLIQQFGDILVVGRMERNGEVKHKLQFATTLTKKSSDEKGVVKRILNFSPRISGFAVQDLPENADASMAKIVEVKAKKFGG